jgi:ribosomal protein S7
MFENIQLVHELISKMFHEFFCCDGKKQESQTIVPNASFLLDREFI